MKIPGKKLEHHGIKIEFVGQIGEMLLFFILLITILLLINTVFQQFTHVCTFVFNRLLLVEMWAGYYTMWIVLSSNGY